MADRNGTDGGECSSERLKLNLVVNSQKVNEVRTGWMKSVGDKRRAQVVSVVSYEGNGVPDG